MMIARTVVLLAACAASCSAAAAEIREWPVPWENTRPRDPTVAPNGYVWFVGQTGNYLGVYDPDGNRFARFDLPPGTAPHTVVADPSGDLWVAGNGNATLLRMAPNGAVRTKLEIPAAALPNADPHTIVLDGKGGLWFTMQNANAIGHLDIAAGKLRIERVATAQARPYGIVATPDGDAWFVLFGVGKLARVARADLAITEIALPRPLSRPRRLGIDANGHVWYVDYAGHRLGRHDPATGKTDEWPTPSQPSGPYALAIDPKDRPLFFETAVQPNLLQTFDPATQQFGKALAVPGGGGAVRHMELDRKRNSVWFGTDKNTLGQVVLD
jgi:virginiamycin B lyase